MTKIINCILCNPNKDLNKGILAMDKEIEHLKGCGWEINEIGVLLCMSRNNYTACIKFDIRKHIEHLYNHKTPIIDNTKYWSKQKVNKKDIVGEIVDNKI